MEIVDTIKRDKCYLISEIPNSAEMLQISAENTGYWYRARYSLVRSCGRKSCTYILAGTIPGDDTPILDQIKHARKSVCDLCGINEGDFGRWTFPGMARYVTDWLGIYHRCTDVCRLLVPVWHYQMCIPCELQQGYMYDIKSAYWQIVKRVPSPLIDIIDGRLQFQVLSIGQEHKWELLKERLEPHKKLRLCLIGANAAGWKRFYDCDSGVQCFKDGKKLSHEKTPSKNGALMSMALLAVRSIYEIMQIQNESEGSVYCNADSYLGENRTGPEYWQHLKLAYGLKAQGRTDILALGAWRVGETMTKPYMEMVQSGALSWHYPKRLTDKFWHKEFFK